MIQVAENLFRGPRPKDLRHLKSLGIDTIIDLESGILELFTNDVYERQSPPDYDIKDYHLKCSDIWPPSEWAARRAVEIIKREAAAGRKVYLHCLTGKDRTGFVVAVYRMMVEGWSLEEARREWVLRGRHLIYFWWSYYLAPYARRR